MGQWWLCCFTSLKAKISIRISVYNYIIVIYNYFSFCKLPDCFNQIITKKITGNPKQQYWPLPQAAPSVWVKSWTAAPPGREWDSRLYPAWSLAALGWRCAARRKGRAAPPPRACSWRECWWRRRATNCESTSPPPPPDAALQGSHQIRPDITGHMLSFPEQTGSGSIYCGKPFLSGTLKRVHHQNTTMTAQTSAALIFSWITLDPFVPFEIRSLMPGCNLV